MFKLIESEKDLGVFWMQIKSKVEDRDIKLFMRTSVGYLKIESLEDLDQVDFPAMVIREESGDRDVYTILSKRDS